MFYTVNDMMSSKSIQNLLYYSAFLLVTLSALYLIKALDISYPLTISTTTRSGELAVVGEGKVEAVPDTGYVDAGIAVRDAATAEAAQQNISDVNNKIIVAMKKLGIDKADIKTSQFSIFPNYNYKDGTNRISGYSGNATITVKVKDLNLVSKVITEATAAGANQINSTRFAFDSPEKYREEARDKAIENARGQAEKLAKQLDIKLGRVVNIVESTPGNIYPMPLRAEAVTGLGGGAPQIEPGTQTVTSTVTLYFEKK